MIAHGLPIYVALEPVDMRLGAERLGALVRERMRAEPRSRALFVFVGKRGQSMKVLTWDGTGTIVVHKKRDAGRFELPRPTTASEQHLLVSDAIFEAIHKGVAITPRATRRRVHVLAAMLAEWKLGGWAAMMERAPTPDDLIVPLPPDAAE